VTGITGVTSDDYLRFNWSLKQDDLSIFDVKPNSSLIVLKKSDFDENENWPQFVSRYARTPQSSRGKYYLEKMSNSLKEELIWSLVQLVQDPLIPEDDKKKIKIVLKEDFQIDAEKIKTRKDLYAQYDKIKGNAAIGTYYMYDNDSIRNSHSTLWSNYISGGTRLPFRSRKNRLRVDPKIDFYAGYVTGERKLEDQEEEDIGYFLEIAKLDLHLRDSKRDHWNFGGLAQYTGRQMAPDGYPNHEVMWSGSGGFDHLFNLPLDLTVEVNGVNKRYLPPAEEDQFHRYIDQINLNIPLTLVFKDFALKGGYSLYYNDEIGLYSFEEQVQHTGYLWTRFQRVDGYREIGLNYSDVYKHRGRQTDEGLIKENTKRKKASLGGEYMLSLGKGKSIWAAGLLNYTHSEGDLNADFFGYYFGLNGSVNIVSNFEMSLNGNIKHDLIYQDGQDYDLTYSLFPGLAWHITKSITLSGSGVFQHSLSEGKYEEDSKMLSGDLAFTASFDWFTQMNVKLSGGGGKEWDGSNYDYRFVYLNGEWTFLF
jgi:hypothetical protein